MFVIEVLAPALGKFGPKRLRSKGAAFIVVLSDKSKIEDLITYEVRKHDHREFTHPTSRANDINLQHMNLIFGFSSPKKATTQLYIELTDTTLYRIS